MTNIEQKAMELVNAVREPAGLTTIGAAGTAYRSYGACWKALCRALEAHDADKSRHAAEMREQAERFSEAAGKVLDRLKVRTSLAVGIENILSPFILAPVDPIVEALEAAGWRNTEGDQKGLSALASDIRAALEARGLHIVAKEPQP